MASLKVPRCYIHLRSRFLDSTLHIKRGFPHKKSKVPENGGHEVEEVVGLDRLVGLLGEEGDDHEDKDEGEQKEAGHYQQLQRYH